MQLFISPTSPFARLVMVMALQAKIDDLQLIFVNPWENPAELLKVNPFSQVPALLTDKSHLITETPLIVNYLTPQVFADESQTTLISFAITLINQVVRAFSLQRFQPENSTPHPFIARSIGLLQNALPNMPTLHANSEDWGHIFLGVSLGYLQMRLPDIYDTSVAADNKIAFHQFSQCDFMQKTTAANLEKLQDLIKNNPSQLVTIADL